MKNWSYRLLHGDCLERLKEIPDASVDMILTDLPYGVTACKWDNVIPFEPMWEQVWRVLKSNGVCLFFGTEPFSSSLRLSQLKAFKYDWIWHKSKPSGIATSKYMPMKNHEIVSVFADKKTLFFPIKEERDWTKVDGGKREITKFKTKNFGGSHLNKTDIKKQFSDLRNPTTIKFFKSIAGQNSKHPTQKPVPLLEYLITTYTQENETVLDFTMGSGSTGVAALNLKRKFIGIELEREYFRIARKRCREAIEGGMR